MNIKSILLIVAVTLLAGCVTTEPEIRYVDRVEYVEEEVFRVAHPELPPKVLGRATTDPDIISPINILIELIENYKTTLHGVVPEEDIKSLTQLLEATASRLLIDGEYADVYFGAKENEFLEQAKYNEEVTNYLEKMRDVILFYRNHDIIKKKTKESVAE